MKWKTLKARGGWETGPGVSFLAFWGEAAFSPWIPPGRSAEHNGPDR